MQSPARGNQGTASMANRGTRLATSRATARLFPISGLALAIGVVAAFVALALLRLIGLFTNLFYFGRRSTALISPSGNHLGIFAVLVPVGGALIIGLMARYGSERIGTRDSRGHRTILINGSRVEAKVASLEPISSVISIGSGGPFGAEGPSIMTGGAVGSTIAHCSTSRAPSARPSCWRGQRRRCRRRSRPLWPPCCSRWNYFCSSGNLAAWFPWLWLAQWQPC
jgi:H+/Cl- antiporter ClcA